MVIEDPDYERLKQDLHRAVTDQREHLLDCMSPAINSLIKRQLIGVLAGQISRVAGGKQELIDIENSIELNEDFASW